MVLRVADFVGRPRDSVEETRLAQDLRRLPGEEAFAFINDYVQADPVVGLMLANRVLREPRYFEQILREALLNPDASGIRYYIDACIPRLGPERVLAIFEETLESNFRAAQKALYHTRLLLLQADPSLKPRLDALRDVIERHEIRGD